MKTLWILIAAAAPILAQEPQTAPPTIQLRPPDLNFRDFKLPGRPAPFALPVPVMGNPVKAYPIFKLEALAKPPAACAIPLIQVTPKGDFTMKVVRPPQPEPNIREMKVPAPACTNWNR